MGQRLVISVNKENKCLAKIYYHWSAYTVSALYETSEVINCIYNHQDETDDELLLRLIHFCEEHGGGIDGGKGSSEWNYITAKYPNEKFEPEHINRNDGLIAISENGMAEMQRWSEGDVYIELDDDRVDFCVYAGYETWNEFVRERQDWDDEFDLAYDDVPYVDCCLGYFDVSEVDDILAQVDAAAKKYDIIRVNDEIVELIQ